MENNEKVEGNLLEKQEATLKVKAYKRRWIILVIYMLYSAVNSFQWIEYSSITHLVVKYYHVSSLAVDWTSIIYMALYPIFVIPASYIIDKKGLRTAGLIGCLGTLLGTGVKVFSIRSDLFYVVMIGQTIVSASQIVIICLPPKIASIWFKPNEVSTACSLGVFGIQMGPAIGYLLPPMIVQYSDDLDVIGSELKLLCWILAGVIVPISIAVLLYFHNQPPLPPSAAQATLREEKEKFQTKAFFQSLKKLFLNKPFVIHMFAYGINIAVTSAIGTLLSQFILQYFKGADEDAGRMGFVMIIVGMAGMLVFGVILDKTHKYKEITFFTYFAGTLSMVFFMYSLKWKSLWLTYVACAIAGLFFNAYMPVGFELAMELTFPAEESTTTGILMAMTQLLGTPLAVATGIFNKWVGCFWSLAILTVLLLIGTVITAFIPNHLLRQDAFKQNNGNMKRRASRGSRLLHVP